MTKFAWSITALVSVETAQSYIRFWASLHASTKIALYNENCGTNKVCRINNHKISHKHCSPMTTLVPCIPISPTLYLEGEITKKED